METVLGCGRCKRTLPIEAFSKTDAAKGPGRWCKACHRACTDARRGIIHKDDPRPCLVCGTMFRPKQRRVALYCSTRCKSRDYQPRLNAYKRQRRAAERAQRTPDPSRCCRWCGRVIAPTKRADAKFCSRSCTMAAHRPANNFARRANLPKPGAVTLLQLAERDGWCCQLCDGPVDVEVRYPDPWSASIDHVLPVSKGGSHDIRNLQLAHLGCNSRKRDHVAA